MSQNDASGIAGYGIVTTRTSKTRAVEMLARLQFDRVAASAHHFTYSFDRARRIEELTKLSATWTGAAEAGCNASTGGSVNRCLCQKTAHRDISNRATIDGFDAPCKASVAMTEIATCNPSSVTLDALWAFGWC